MPQNLRALCTRAVRAAVHGLAVARCNFLRLGATVYEQQMTFSSGHDICAHTDVEARYSVDVSFLSLK